MNKLNYSDYVDILKFYKIDAFGLKRKDVKSKAEHLLATKLCKCIKKIKQRTTKIKESKAIAICNDSVIRKKGLKTFKFQCKKGARLLGKKGTRKILLVKRGASPPPQPPVIGQAPHHTTNRGHISLLRGVWGVSPQKF